ncbi:hypothetical protein SUGI_1196850 [Cryptomeria japonica]|uniref:uncharacterized protein LOC131079016 n=1 Tax=Cryptomeria japonica TaxID=3369 RepID=UPI0024149E3C|nr:uncharacterized protein LOC131079016 [Cryptomeria japonica]GLJ55719.1 hypothetical protein SUGI_1196850 [Cryptomeria japonica]
MDGEAAEFHFLDAFGIVGEACKIVRREAKLLGGIALTLLLPLPFIIQVYRLISEPLLSKIMMNVALSGIEVSSPAAESIRHNLHFQIAELLLMTALYVTLVFAFSLLSRSAVVYTVAATYAGKELVYTKIMRIVPRVWKRLILTFLWFFLIMFLYHVVTVVALTFWILIYGAFGLKKETLIVGVFLIFIVAFPFYVYITLLWQLASVVCVVEDKQGLSAVKKSNQLIKGKRGTALTLNILYGLFMVVIGGVQSYSVYGKGQQLMSVGFIVMVVLLQCVVDLVWLLTHAVLYFVCKSCHHEDIDLKALSNHLETYNGGYMLLKDGSVDFEMFIP